MPARTQVGGVLLITGGEHVTEGGSVLTWTGLIRRNWEGLSVWYLKLRTFIASLLEDDSGASAVEYALIMALVAVFIIAAVILIWWWLAP